MSKTGKTTPPRRGRRSWWRREGASGGREEQAQRERQAQRDESPAHLSRALRLAGWVLFWERLRQGAWIPASLFLLFVAFAMSGFFDILPTWLHIFLLAVFFAALLLSLLLPGGALVRLRFPGEGERARRLEQENALTHRPLRSRHDVPILNADNGLWQAHRDWQSAQTEGILRAGLPKPLLAARDSYALRVAALLLAVAAVGIASDPLERLWHSVAPFAEHGGGDVHVDVWITPPAYTGRAPLYPDISLDGNVTQDMQVPENSRLVIQLEGGKDATLRIRAEDAQDAPPAPQEDAEDAAVSPPSGGGEGELRNFAPLDDGRLEYRTTLTRTSEVVLSLGGRRGGASAGEMRWRFAVLPDLPPEVEFTAPVGFTHTGSLRIEYATRDDYGVVTAGAHIERDFTEAENQRHPPLRPHSPLVSDEIITLPLSPSLEGEESNREYHDLTSHPWAGLPVRMRLVAQDSAGRKGFSETITLRLPQVAFESPLARAFMELRQRLAINPETAGWVAQMLDAMALGADIYETRASDWLHLRVAYWKLRFSLSEESLEETRALLWHMALRAESGELPDLKERLRAMQEALQEALAAGAPESEIRELLERFGNLLSQYLREQARDSIARGEAAPTLPNDGREYIDAQQLSDMLESIGEMSSVGAFEEAQQMLADLEEILENLQFAAPTPQERAIGQALDELERLEQQQQNLMDRTFQDQLRDCPPGEVCEARDGRSLQELQESLRSQLQELLQEMGEGGLEMPAPLQAGERSMGAAVEGLGQGDLGEGLHAQGRALEQLRQGRDELLRQSGGGLAGGRPGRGGRGGGSSGFGNNDPLGRSLADGAGWDDGSWLGEDFVPERFNPQRARELRTEILRRMGEAWRPREELNYLERLLQQNVPTLAP